MSYPAARSLSKLVAPEAGPATVVAMTTAARAGIRACIGTSLCTFSGGFRPGGLIAETALRVNWPPRTYVGLPFTPMDKRTARRRALGAQGLDDRAGGGTCTLITDEHDLCPWGVTMVLPVTHSALTTRAT